MKSMHSSSIFWVTLFILVFKFVSCVLIRTDEDFFGHEADTYNWLEHPCRRKCLPNQPPKICRYAFIVEQFSSMSKACYDCPFNVTDCFRPHCVPADGVQKLIYTVNRQMPGPLVEVCENDIVEVEVRNRMLSESTAIHWHGFKQQGTPYMDGVPYVTQCPILPGENFRYIFNATTTGTFFWHSHIGSQRADGLYGPMLVNRFISEDTYRNLYDFNEHFIIVTDWMHQNGDPVFIQEYYDAPNTHPDNILINGLGRFRKFEDDDGSIVYTPSAVFSVQRDKRYKFRFINGGSEDCPIELSIDNHTMTIVNLDSHDIVATEVDAITSYPGERVDFVLEANQKSNNYWMRFRGYAQCRKNATNGVHQVAILNYNDVPVQDPKELVAYDLPKLNRSSRILNPHNLEYDATMIKVPDLIALDANDVSLNEKVNHQFYISYDFFKIDNYDFARKGLYGFNQVPVNRQIGTVQLNHITLRLPAFPLLSQRDLLTDNSFCNTTHTPKDLNCTVDYCACTHVLQVRLHSVVELILIDEGNGAKMIANHPFHLHGHFFRVVAEEKLNGTVTIDRVKQLDKEGKVRRRLDHPPIKDTMKAPKAGYTIVRFYANNPGYWFFHCHFEQHTNIGMALVFKVGEHEDFPKVPDGFPRCGGYTPSIM